MGEATATLVEHISTTLEGEEIESSSAFPGSHDVVCGGGIIIPPSLVPLSFFSEEAMISNAYNQWKESSTTKNATTNAMNGNMADRSEKGCEGGEGEGVGVRKLQKSASLLTSALSGAAYDLIDERLLGG